MKTYRQAWHVVRGRHGQFSGQSTITLCRKPEATSVCGLTVLMLLAYAALSLSSFSLKSLNTRMCSLSSFSRPVLFPVPWNCHNIVILFSDFIIVQF
jgi:hypothetical protein